jgi:hypothetical protein
MPTSSLGPELSWITLSEDTTPFTRRQSQLRVRDISIDVCQSRDCYVLMLRNLRCSPPTSALLARSEGYFFGEVLIVKTTWRAQDGETAEQIISKAAELTHFVPRGWGSIEKCQQRGNRQN